MNLKEKYRRFRAWQLNPFDYTNRSEHLERCANCGTEFNDNFCPRCGQKAGTGPIGWHTVSQGVMLIWGMDSRSLSYSLVQLLLRPGYMISDYLSGKRQVSFPPVKMLLIVAIGVMVAEWLFGEPSVETTPDAEEIDVAFDAFEKWAESNGGWGMLLVTCMLIFPTWLYFRYAPKHHKHSIPEGFFIQVFMGSLMAITAILSAIFDSDWVLCIIPIYYIITYRQLFGFGWWGTLWRTSFCICQGCILIFVVIWVANYIMGAPHRSPLTIILGIGTTLFLTLIWYGVERGKRYMSSKLLVAVVMTTMTLTSCNIDINNDSDVNPEEYHAQVANTRWQLAEVMNQNNEWVSPEFYEGLNIPELSFDYNNGYVMRICTLADRTDIKQINGTYSLDQYFSITMTDWNYQGIAYTLKVTTMNSNILEGEFIDWRLVQRSKGTASDDVAATNNPRYYTIRMKRTSY